MTASPLLIFDLDGVIVNGMNEYWWSSKQTLIRILGKGSQAFHLPKSPPQAFSNLRPWVHHGWEMVLLAGELIRPKSVLSLQGPITFSNNYESLCAEALKSWEWSPKFLQKELETTRRDAISTNKSAWLALHKTFPGIANRLNSINQEGIQWGVLSTKGKEFTIRLLEEFDLHPSFVYGHEAGSKVDVLKDIVSRDQIVYGFIEDRRATLENVLRTPELSSIRCYLANWGYLKPEDKKSLPNSIHLLNQEIFATPLATWP